MNILALDVGGTHVRSAWVRNNSVHEEVMDRTELSRISNKAGGSANQAVLEALLTHIRERLAHQSADAVALGVPGFITAEGIIITSPNLPGLKEFPLEALLKKTLGMEVVVANDALCAARGAWFIENPRPKSLAILTLGTGVGGGLIVDGRPLFGDGGTAMEIGHVTVVPDGRLCGCGKRGCLEQYASATALKKMDSESEGGKSRGAHLLAEDALRGEPSALELYKQAGRRLGQAVAALVMLTDVRTVRIGGGLSRAWELLADDFAEQMEKDLIPALHGKIDTGPVAADMVDRVGLIGAAALANAYNPSE